MKLSIRATIIQGDKFDHHTADVDLEFAARSPSEPFNPEPVTGINRQAHGNFKLHLQAHGQKFITRVIASIKNRLSLIGGSLHNRLAHRHVFYLRKQIVICASVP
jgi:hypothetical protein